MMAVRCRRSTFSHVAIADNAALDLAGDWCIEVCVRAETQPTTGQYFAIVTKGGLDATTTANYWLGYYNDGGTLKLGAGFVDDGGTTRSFGAAYTLTTGRWYALRASYDQGTGRLALEAVARQQGGSAVASALVSVDTETFAGTPTPATNSQPIRVGVSVTSAGAYQHGGNLSICELRLFDTDSYGQALDNTYGRNSVTYRDCGAETNMVGYWPMDESRDTTAYDLTGTGNSGTLTHGSWWTDDPSDLWYEHGDLTNGFLGWQSATLMPGASVTASSTDANYPTSNLLSPISGLRWKSASSGASFTLTWDFGRAVPLLGVSIWGWQTTGSLTAALSSANSWSPASFSERVAPRKRTNHVFSPGVQHYRFARLTFAAVTGTIWPEAGAIHWWTAHELTHPSRTDGETRPVQDPSTAVTTQHGARTPRELTPLQSLSVSFPKVPKREAIRLRDILRRVGGGAPVWLCTDPKRELHRAVYGTVSAMPRETPRDIGPEWFSFDGLTVEADIC